MDKTMIGKTIIGAASCYNKKYFFNPEMSKLPKEIQNDIKTIAVCLAEKLHGIFTVGFYEDGSLYFEAVADENDFDFDEIGAHLEIERLKREEKELIDSLMLWYKIFKRGKM